MTGSRLLSGARTAGLSLAAVIGCALVLPSRAEAACGDWLAHPPQAQGAFAGDDSPGSTPAVPAHMPCRGPSCSSRDESPVVPSAPVVSVSVERWALPGSSLVPPPVDLVRNLTNDGPCRPLCCGTSIFRPPRLRSA